MPDSSPLFFAAIAVRTAIVLVALIVGIRVFGKRQIGAMNVYDLVLVLAVANAVQNAMTRGSGQLGVGIAAAGTLLVLGRLLGLVFVRRPALERRVVGVPTLIVQDGQLNRANMRREGITEDEVQAAAREYGLADLSEVRLAVLEPDGSLSVVPKEKDPP
jgi:uncharacterized membrane protein YcaP (DUF421 family)